MELISKEKTRIAQNFKGIIDSTLREGLQFSRANFALPEMEKIQAYLTGIGVEYIEVGNPAKPEIKDMIMNLSRLKAGSPTKILTHIRNNTNDLARAVESGVDGVNILCTADPDRLASLNMTPQDYMNVLKDNIHIARDNGLEVRVGVEDFFGLPWNRIFDIHGFAQSLGAKRICVSDTLGKAMGWEVENRIRKLRSRLSVDIEVHFHNDLGHAVSNSIIALQAGANWIDTTLLGIGERTGITALSSLLINLHVIRPEMAARYNLSLLTEAENYVSRICRIDTPVNLATNKVNGFAHKAGIHLQALMCFGPQKYELYSPVLIGNRRNLVINSLISGKTTKKEVRAFREKYG